MRRLASNTLIALGGTTALKALGLVTTLVLARGLGDDGFGVYSFVGVFMFFLGFVVDLGMERVVTRELAAAPARIPRLLGNAIILKLALSVVAIPAAYLIARLMGVPDDVRYCILIAALGLPFTVELMFRSYLQSQFQMGYAYAVTLPTGVTFLLLAWLCVRWSLPVSAIFWAALLNGAFTLGLLLLITLPRVRPVLRPERALLGMLVRDAGEVGLFVVMFMLAMRIDQLLLFQLRGAPDVGQYAVAVKVTEALSIVPEALMLTVFPLLASTHNSAPGRFRRTYRLSFKYLSAIILPVALVLTVARHDVVVIAFGEHYRDSATPLAILAWGMFFTYTGAVYLNLFIVQRQQRLLLLVSLITLALNIGLNVLLIPPYGASGSAAATLVASFAGFVCWLLIPATAPFMTTCFSEAARPLLSVAVAWLALSWLSLSGLTAALLGVALYAVVLVLSGGIGRGDVDLIRRFLTAESTPGV